MYPEEIQCMRELYSPLYMALRLWYHLPGPEDAMITATQEGMGDIDIGYAGGIYYRVFD